MASFISYLANVIAFNKGLSGIPFSGHRRIYSNWRSQVESKKFPLDLELPWITLIAKDFIEQFLSSKTKCEIKIFEFGAGGSSLFFLKLADEVYSVEHDKEWFNLIKSKIANESRWSGHLIEPEFLGANQTKDLDIANPAHYYSDDEKFRECTFKSYATSIDKFQDGYFDLVLVDGRSRPSCLSHSLSKIKKGGLLVLDNAERNYYLSQNIIKDSEFELEISSYGALICYNQYTRTNIYRKK